MLEENEEDSSMLLCSVLDLCHSWTVLTGLQSFQKLSHLFLETNTMSLNCVVLIMEKVFKNGYGEMPLGALYLHNGTLHQSKSLETNSTNIKELLYEGRGITK